MSTRRPIHPVLTAVPNAAFAIATVSLLAHALTDEAAWYDVALYADVIGVLAALVAFTVGLVDAQNVPAHTVARQAGMSRAGFTALALVLFAGSAMVMFRHYENNEVLADAAPLALAVLGGAAMAISGWYGRVLMQLFRQRHRLERYTPAHGLVTPRAPHPRTVPTIG